MTFVTDYLLKDVYMRNNLRRHSVSLQSKGPACSLPTHYKGFRSPKLRVPFLLYNLLHVQVSPGPLCVALWELGLGEQKQTLILWYYYLLWAIESFVSALGVLCLLPTFTKLWQVTLLACK